MRIHVLVFDGFDLLDVFGPVEPLTAAGWEVELVHMDGPRWVTAQQGFRIEATAALGGPDPIDGLIVPGGGWLNRAEHGAWAEVQNGHLTHAIADLSARTPWLASVCSGGMILASAGLLAGRRATTNRACFDEFRPLVGEVIDARVVDDGDRITAGALSSGLDLGLHLVSRFVGADAADDVSRRLEYPPRTGQA